MGRYVIWVSMSHGLTSDMHGSLCYLSVSVTWSHHRSVWVSMWSEFLYHLVSLLLCMGPCVAWVSMSLDLTFGMHRSLCCLNFYVTWSRFHYIWVLVLSEFLYHFISLPLYMGLVLSEFRCHLVSPPLYMGPCVVWISMSLDLAFIRYGSLCCLSFYITWSRFHYIWVLCCLNFYVTWSRLHYIWILVLSEFLCHLISLPLYMGPFVVWVSISIDIASII